MGSCAQGAGWAGRGGRWGGWGGDVGRRGAACRGQRAVQGTHPGLHAAASNEGAPPQPQPSLLSGVPPAPLQRPSHPHIPAAAGSGPPPWPPRSQQHRQQLGKRWRQCGRTAPAPAPAPAVVEQLHRRRRCCRAPTPRGDTPGANRPTPWGKSLQPLGQIAPAARSTLLVIPLRLTFPSGTSLPFSRRNTAVGRDRITRGAPVPEDSMATGMVFASFSGTRCAVRRPAPANQSSS
jgi:hypothetical protein